MATGKILINLYDSTRQLVPAGTEVLLTLTDGNKRTIYRNNVKGPTINIPDVTVYDNFGDQYTVLISRDNVLDTGFFPVDVSANLVRTVSLMILPEKAEFNFSQFNDLLVLAPQLYELLSQGADDAASAQRRYEDLKEVEDGKDLACLLNILTACRDIPLPQGTVLQYFRQLVWNNATYPMKQDRFYVWADPTLVTQVRTADNQGSFAEEPNPGLLHPGATTSYKQIQFGEANVQLTFHEKEPSPAGTNWVLVEPDIDYFKDMVAHTVLEVIPGFFGLTDPKIVYLLRWMAGRQGHAPEFNPPYTVRPAAG
ncbi:MAG TPA: hypothetical protein VGK48_27265 [Terriglobia bacterium]|jgi:hypothetical protein